VTLSAKQLDSVKHANGRVNVWDGSIRSGKTIGSLLRWLIFVADPPKGGELVMFGRTRDSIWRNVIAPLQDPALFGGASAHVVGNYGAPTVSILGRRVYLIGASDAKAELVIRGMTVAGCYGDELTTVPEQFFTQMLGRMSVPGAQMFGTTNPDNPAHWLKRKFLDRLSSLPDWRRFTFRLADNPSLTSRYVASISAEYTGLWHRRFIDGEWVAAEGAVYDMWDEARHMAVWDAMPRMVRLLACGLDYGTTNATAALILGLGSDRRLYLVDEWRHDPAAANGDRWSDARLSAGLRAWLGGRHLPWRDEPAVEWVAVDPAAASLKVQLYTDGVPNVIDADNNVAYGIRTTASLLSTGQLMVSNRCRGWLNEVTGYAWDPKATERGEDKPLKVADHSLDAARYAVATTESLWRGMLLDPALEGVAA
jgi:PBSX family phage terminase large subunit